MGAREGNSPILRNLTPEEVCGLFPKLQIGHNYEKTSKANPRYNCVAFANNDERKWWQAGKNGGAFHWPSNVNDTLDGWVQLFVDQGYELTSSRDVEPGAEKVAIYVNLKDLTPSHVAISDGTTWKSKLGRIQDISHATLELLEGDGENDYGIVERVLRRAKAGIPGSL